MQTWEYAPQYALRTYAYLLPLSFISQLISFLPIEITKPILFKLLRCIIASFTAYTEVEFVHSLAIYLDTANNDENEEKVNPLSIHLKAKSLIPFWTILTSLFSAGMFHASPALLPSAQVMQLLMLSFSYYFKGNESIAVFWGLVAVLATGWPFCALLWVPMGYRIIFDALLDKRNTVKNDRKPLEKLLKQVRDILQRTLLHAMAIQTIVSLIDYYYYGDAVFPTINILEYNAASGGDELYGVEDIYFYMKNLLVNWNGAALLAIISLLPNISWNENKHIRIIITPMILWMFIVFPRPHKEERFLFPIYPILSFACALTLDTVITLMVPVFVQPKRSDFGAGVVPNYQVWIQGWSSKIGTIIVLCIGAVSILRSMALSQYYTAPLNLYEYLHNELIKQDIKDKNVNVCVAGEWHRFPSSFFLPYSTTTLAYLPSRFKGQLPAYFQIENDPSSPTPFNDLNKEEPSRYIKGGISSCDYLIDLRLEGRDEEPEGLQHIKEDKKGGKFWNEIYDTAYLDAERTGFLDRILYLPWRSQSSRIFAPYILFKNERK